MDVARDRAKSLLIVATVAGTIQAFLTPYATHFRGVGWRVEAAANGASSNPSLTAAFDRVHELPLTRSLRDVRGMQRAWRALEEILESPPAIVHVHTPIASFLTRLLIRRLPADRRPLVVYTAHGFHFHEGGRMLTNAVFRTAERLAGRWTDRLIVINDEDETAARRYRIVSERRLVRMPGIGLDTERYSPSAVDAEAAARLRYDLAIPAGAAIFAIVGELNRNKRPTDAIAAIAEMRDATAQLVFAGRGPARVALEAYSREAGVADRVHFLGEVPDVRPIVLAATALLLLSKREGLARSVMEALALGVPVIASTARGNRQLVADDAGLLIETGDVRGLAEAMDWMLDNPDARRRMGIRGRARMVDGYDLRVLIRLHEALYTSMLAELHNAS